jgi:ATP-dependent DNA helicase RecQ
MCLEQVHPTKHQDEMGNSYHRTSNLDGAFDVNPKKVLPGPVLLVDDKVDSRWTFTVVGALLRDNGISAVLPFALATTNSGS